MRSRHSCVLMLALPFLMAGIASFSGPRPASAGEGEVLYLMPDRKPAHKALRSSLDPVDPDTVWIGHVWDPSYRANTNYPAGGAGPYHVGRGPNRPVNPFASQSGWNGVWDFDRFQPGENDSLQGWWTLARPFQSVGGSNNPDYQRPFQGFDYGNQANYRLPQPSNPRTFGTIGLWHRDIGNAADLSGANVAPGTNPVNVLWSPTLVGGPGSTACAWMGIRAHGDLTHRDDPSLGGTGNWFNASVNEYNGNNAYNQVGSTREEGTDKNYPGYGSQLDQMLYRDIQLNETEPLTISFNYSTNMSLGFNTTANIRVGWYQKDPVSSAQNGSGPTSLPSSDGNFISSSLANDNAPRDSFMVYIGAPVNDLNVTFSAPLIVLGSPVTTVYDKKRRWFSEVLRIKPSGQGQPTDLLNPGREIFMTAGVHAPTSFSLTIPNSDATLQAIKDVNGVGGGGTVRLVFRVKTNRGSDDEDTGNAGNGAFSSGTRGAVLLDNVVVNNWPAANGNFEAADAINNDVAVSPLNAWKSTGKPPGVYFHAHLLATGSGLIFDDPCGSLDSPNRFCNMYGKVISAGDHDLGEKSGGPYGSNSQDRQKWMASPTVNLRSTGNGAYNDQGIDDEVAHVGDYILFFDVYTAGLKGATNGNLMSVGYQAYPATQPNGVKCWGETRHEPFIYFFNLTACAQAFFPGARAAGLLKTTNVDNTPDSIRVYLHQMARCFTFTTLSEADCSPNTGANAGIYYDNMSLALIDSAPPAGVNVAIWDLINDCFPSTSNSALTASQGIGGIGTAFDTTAAQVRTGFNTAQATGDATRPNIAGDTTVVTAAGAGVRLDMIFHILPGPGNYVTPGNRTSGVARRPDANGAGRVAATALDLTNFWGAYLANNGIFGSPGGHPLGKWSEHVWNSARMDTAERNLFPTANNGSVVGLPGGVYATMLHEGATGSEDQTKFNNLGITKNRCFMVVPTGDANSTNISCSGLPPVTYTAAAGYNGVPTTKEYTKILPDGQLTPGSHVEYFFRKSKVADPPTVYQMGPDTTVIFQDSEGSFDGHRWQEFSVLPDRWKDNAWSINDRHAPAPACMLFVDWADRRGEELAWVSLADSIGATSEARRGAHNGWKARGDQDITVAIATDPSIAVYAHGGQPGTIWDMFGVKAAESISTGSGSLGSRAAPSASGLATGKETRHGPLGDVLRNYYRNIVILTGDLVDGEMGPYADKGDNDIGLLVDFANTPAGSPQPRSVFLAGQGFILGQANTDIGHPGFTETYFGASLASGNYRLFGPNFNNVVDLRAFPPTNTTNALYGVSNNCFIGNNVMTHTSPQGLNSVSVAKYPDVGATEHIAGIYVPSSLPSSVHPFVTVLDGFRSLALGSQVSLRTQGRIDYFFRTLTTLYGSLNCTFALAQPVGVGDTPNAALVNFLALRSENPWRSGQARIVFGLAKTEHVDLRIYDISGRLVRTVANRVFAAGQDHTVIWDGTNDSGDLVARGVYFYQLRTPTFISQKKLAVLKN